MCGLISGVQMVGFFPVYLVAILTLNSHFVRPQWFLHPRNESAATTAASSRIFRRQMIPSRFPYSSSYMAPWKAQQQTFAPLKGVYTQQQQPFASWKQQQQQQESFAPFNALAAWQRYASTPLSAVVAMQEKKAAVSAEPSHGKVITDSAVPKGVVASPPNAPFSKHPAAMATSNNNKEEETILPRLNIPNQKQLTIPPQFRGPQFRSPLVRQFVPAPKTLPATRRSGAATGRFPFEPGHAPGASSMLAPRMIGGTPNLQQIRKQYTRLKNSSQLRNAAAKILYSSRNPAVRVNILKRLFTPDFSKIVDNMRHTMKLDMRMVPIVQNKETNLNVR